MHTCKRAIKHTYKQTCTNTNIIIFSLTLFAFVSKNVTLVCTCPYALTQDIDYNPIAKETIMAI